MVDHKRELHNKLLTLPKSDFPSLQNKQNELSGLDNSDSCITNNEEEADPPLLLLSLPPSLQTSDLSSSEFFLSDNNGCRLVNESKGITFDLLKVESSNAYVMFPPPKRAKTTFQSKGDDKSNKNNVNQGTELRGRLLRENNTFFMECEMPKSNLEQLISDHLNEHFIYPPSRGISIPELSKIFQYSQKEVYKVLENIGAFQIPLKRCNNEKNSIERHYGVISEEVERDTWNIIISVLSEWDGCVDYAQTGVDLNEMIKYIISKDGCIEEGIVRHFLGYCTISENSVEKLVGQDSSMILVKLDAKIIATKLAHQLFHSRSAPWEESQFLSEWHRLMPGVGKEYEPNIDLLKGIAISVMKINPMLQESHSKKSSISGNEKDVIYWKYFPRESLPSSENDKFRMIFKEKARWKLEELKSYLEEKQEEALLLKYTRRFEDSQGCIWCESKQAI